jgi:hypothetical protein
MFKSPFCLWVMGLGTKMCAITGDFDRVDFSKGKKLGNEIMKDFQGKVVGD